MNEQSKEKVFTGLTGEKKSKPLLAMVKNQNFIEVYNNWISHKRTNFYNFHKVP